MTDTAVSFSKEEFKKKVVSNCKSLYRKNIDEADKQQLENNLCISQLLLSS